MKEKVTPIFVVCGTTILASRVRAGHKEWDTALKFFNGDDRNMTGSSLFHDGKGWLHHVNCMGCKGIEGWAYLTMPHRCSRLVGSPGRLLRTSQPVPITSDGMIHLLSSGTYYAFNLAWLKAERPAPTENEEGTKASSFDYETFLF